MKIWVKEYEKAELNQEKHKKLVLKLQYICEEEIVFKNLSKKRCT